MSKSHRTAEPAVSPEVVAGDSDDAHEVIDVEYETIVYDDVDGHVVEPRAALPEPVRLGDDDDDDDPPTSAAARLSPGDTMPFAMALDDRMADDEGGALLDRRPLLGRDALLDRAVSATSRSDRVDETRAGPVTSDPMATVGVARRRVAAAPPSPAPLVEAGRVAAVERTEPPMPADRRLVAAAVPAAEHTGGIAAPAVEPKTDGHGVVCPFCAHVRAAADEPCPRCTMADTASTRRSTGERIGPWFVLQRKNPTAPGLRFSVLLKLARRGHVTAKSIVRGPTTGQLWRYAGEVKGLSRVFGLCWHCRGEMSPDATTCPKCKSAQEIPDDPDVFLESHALPLMTDAPNDSAAPATAVMREVTPIDEPTTPRRAPAQPAAPRPAATRPTPPKVDRPVIAPEPRVVIATEPRPISRIAASAGVKPTAGDGALSASELAAVFQLAPSVKPGRARRVGRRVWKVTKVAVLLGVLVTAAGAATFYLKPEWREPARAWATPIALDARDRALDAKAWTLEKSDEAWRAAAATIARWRTSPPQPTPPDAPAPADPDAATPARADDVAPARRPTPSVVDASPRVAEGQSSIVDATPSTPASTDRARIAAQLDADRQTWESLMAAKSPTTQAGNAGASVAASGRTTDDAADRRTAELAMATRAALADAERALAQSKAADAAAQQPKPQQQPQPAATPAASKPPYAPPAVTLDDALTRAVTLRQKAFDAQARGDWPGAVAIYEEIAKLPEAAQPSDLQVRLRLARDRAARR